MQFKLEPQYLNKLMMMPRGSQTSTVVNHRCDMPTNTISIDYLNNITLCDCDGWLPIPVGKVMDFDSIEQVFNSEIALALQENVQQQYFSWCAVEHCGIMHNDITRDRVKLNINIDESCNLSCPSCRRSSIMVTDGPEFQTKIESINRIIRWLESYDKDIDIMMSGNGDPLASHIIRPLIRNIRPKPTQKFVIYTNGLLIDKQLAGLPILDSVKEFSISVDAASEQVYQDVRRPGNWKALLRNFEFLKDSGKSSITRLNFAVQNKNYLDLPAFAKLCDDYGFKGCVHQLDDWGTWSVMPSTEDVWTISNGTFQDHNVLSTNHPNHRDAVEMIKSVSDNPAVDLTWPVKQVLNP